MKGRTDHYASFKDPVAKVFFLQGDENNIYRSLESAYLPHYQFLKTSGLADALISKNFLVPFEETIDPAGAMVLKARKISFVTYPYEWTFSQWKDAALLTLKIQYQALKFGMTLKDATPFNIVFEGNKPLFIDISSFEIFKPRQPWQAFKQFSENFYMPLLLVKYFDNIGNDIYLGNLNGIPLGKGLKLLPTRAFFSFHTAFFLALPGKIREHTTNKQPGKPTGSFTLKSSMQFAEQLFAATTRISQNQKPTRWNAYYEKDIDPKYLAEKEKIVFEWVGNAYKVKSLVDFGCNTGNFSKMLATRVASIIAFDEDMRSVDNLYKYTREENITNIQCFVANLVQPTPALGWNNNEREPLTKRLKADLGLALALIHHLTFNSHIRFEMMADFFAEACNELFIEYIPKEDAKVQLLLAGRDDSFMDYSYDNFVAGFKTKFQLVKKYHFANKRVLVHFILNNDEQ